MDISNDKLNVYKDLAKKCESFELFLWTVGSKEPWMIEAGKAETEATLKSIYNGVHIADKQRLFVDMDGTLAEFKPVDTLEVLYEKDYFLNLKPNENVLGAIKQLIAKNDIDVYILSAYLSDSHYALDEKNAWLDKYLPELPQEKRLFVPCGTDKSIVVPGHIKHDDYLLDDYTKNLSEWEPPARGIKLINGINHTNGTWQVSDVPIAFEEINGSAHGYYSHATDSIAIQSGMSESQTLKTMIHEIAHSILHNDNVADAKEKDRQTKEVEAESVAYTVCKHFGIDSSDYSFGYIAGWSANKELNELKSSL